MTGPSILSSIFLLILVGVAAGAQMLAEEPCSDWLMHCQQSTEDRLHQIRHDEQIENRDPSGDAKHTSI